jgi:hypothetical protein
MLRPRHHQIAVRQAHGIGQQARFQSSPRDVLASPPTLLVAKSAIPSEGNWAGLWGNEAVDQKLHDIGTSGPVVLEPDYSKFKVVGLTRDVAESYVPMSISVSYAGQDGTPKPFLMIINWLRVETTGSSLPRSPCPYQRPPRRASPRLQSTPSVRQVQG